MDALQRQQRGPALRAQRLLQRLGIRAEGGELPVAKAQYRDLRSRDGLARDGVQRARRMGRRLAVAISGRQHIDLACGRWHAPVLQCRGVHALACGDQCGMQGLGKAPGGAAFAGHENQAVGLRERAVVGHAGAAATGLPPQHHARDPEQRDAGSHDAQHQRPDPRAFAGVQQQRPVVYALRRRGVLPGQGLATVAVYPALALRGGHAPGVLRIVGRRQIQLAQVLNAQLLQQGQLVGAQGGLAALYGGHVGLCHGIQRQQAEGGGAHDQGSSGGHRQHQQDDPPRQHVQALRQRAAHRAGQLPPSAHAAQQQHQPRDRERQHGERHYGRGHAPGVAQQQGAVQVLHPAWQQRGLVAPQHAAVRGVHTQGLGLAVVKGMHHDAARGQVADFLRAGHAGLYALHQGGHGQVLRRGSRLPRVAQRVEGQQRARNAQHQRERAGHQAQPAVDLPPNHGCPLAYFSW